MDVILVGAGCFGAVLGWVTYRTLRRKEGSSALSDIATVLGVVGGGVVTALFKTPEMFGAYSIGLAVGFFLYFIIGLFISEEKAVSKWMGD